MKGKWRRWVMGLSIHLMLSGAVLAGLRVMDRGYNAFHTRHVRTASLTITDGTAELSVLSRRVRFLLPPEDSMLYYAGYWLTDAPVRVWVYLFSAFTNQT